MYVDKAYVIIKLNYSFDDLIATAVQLHNTAWR